MPGTTMSAYPEPKFEKFEAFPELGQPPKRVEPVHIPECNDTEGLYSRDHFVLPPHYQDHVKGVMIPKGMIYDRTEKIAMNIRDMYRGEEVHMICVLKGSRGFFSQICEFLTKFHLYSPNSPKHVPYLEHYVRLKSYHNTESTGNLQVQSDDLSCLKGKHVLIVEDIVDTGNTLVKFCKHLQDFEPKSIRCVSLVEKRTPKSCGFRADFVGFSVPDEFIVGYCLDYNEYFRDLDPICVLTPEAIKAYAEPPKEAVLDSSDQYMPDPERIRTAELAPKK